MSRTAPLAPGSLAYDVESEAYRWATRTDGIGSVSFTATGLGEGARVDLHVRDFDAVLAGNGWSVTFPAFVPHTVVLEAFRAAARTVGLDAL